MSAFLLSPPLPHRTPRSFPSSLKAKTPPPTSRPPKPSTPSPPSQSSTPPPPPPPQPGFQLIAHDLRNIVAAIKSIFQNHPRTKPRSTTGTKVATAYVQALGVASRTAERVAIRMRSVSGVVSGWRVLRPFVWQLPSAPENRQMWTLRVRRFVRGESVIAGVLKIGGRVIRGMVGVAGGVVKVIGAARGGAEKRGRRLEMKGQVETGRSVVRKGKMMAVRPHSGDPQYMSKAADEALRRRVEELARASRDGKGKGREMTNVNEGQGYILDGSYGDGAIADSGNGVKEEIEPSVKLMRGEEGEVGAVAVVATEETGVNDEVTRRLRRGDNNVSRGGPLVPILSKVPDFAKRGATTVLGVGAAAGLLAALPGVMTGTALFVAGGALLNARVSGVDTETRKMVGRGENRRASKKVVEKKKALKGVEARKGRVVKSGGASGRKRRDRVLEAKAYSVGESQPAVLDTPVIGVLLGWLDDAAFLGERVMGAVKGRIGFRRRMRAEGWELLGGFEKALEMDESVR